MNVSMSLTPASRRRQYGRAPAKSGAGIGVPTVSGKKPLRVVIERLFRACASSMGGRRGEQ